MNSKFSRILISGILVGSLDILSAFLFVFIKTGKPQVFNILKFIASGIFGKAASTGGRKMILAGLILHYLIAFLFTVFFFWLYPRMQILSKNRWASGIIYGAFVWIVMNGVVVPLSNVAHRPFSLTGALINVCILIICIGIPLSLIANSYFGNRPENRKMEI
jgi:hypothetical protein